MDIVHDRAVGINISKRDAKVRLRVPGKRQGTFTTTVSTWGATTPQILELRNFLKKEHVTTLMMEATSDYWKPYFYLLEETLPVVLVNAKAGRNIPGRKTNVFDATWLAQLAAHGLLRASFIPPIRELRDLARTRSIAIRDRTRQIQRMEKFLKGSGIKLSSVVSNLRRCNPFARPGNSLPPSPESPSETPGRLASWAGVCPGSNESADRVKSSHILPGNKYLEVALGIAALSASPSQDTYLSVKYRRIAARHGPMKAVVALEHSILTAAWHMLAEGECYTDLGDDHFSRLDPAKAKNGAITKLNSLGYNVTITPA